MPIHAQLRDQPIQSPRVLNWFQLAGDGSQLRPESGSTVSRKAAIIGGSLGGLTSGLTLRDIGWEVEIFERSPRLLMAQGVGIVAHPASVRYLVERTDSDISAMTSHSNTVRYIDSAGRTIHEQDAVYRFTSFYALYRELLKAFTTDSYHLSHHIDRVEQDESGAYLVTNGSRSEAFDLVVCADGVHSNNRKQLLPELNREYAGYVAWRGVVSEADLSEGTFSTLHEAITYHLMDSSHILTYPIPNTDGSVEPGHRLINWIWYLNMPEGPELESLMTDRNGRRQEVSLPPGGVADKNVTRMHAIAGDKLAGPLLEMVTKSEAPFVQLVVDVDVPRLVFDRICLTGDAATVLRPHVAVGTAKAAEAGWRLASELERHDHDVEAALAAWEPAQLALERDTLRRTQEAGERVQSLNTWRVGDPLPFGLYEEGDSVMPDIK